MSSTKKDNIKESTNQLKESKDKYLEKQNQQVEDAASNMSYTTDKINESVNTFQDENRSYGKERGYFQEIPRTNQQNNTRNIE
jgi:hypothetical protein